MDTLLDKADARRLQRHVQRMAGTGALDCLEGMRRAYRDLERADAADAGSRGDRSQACGAGADQGCRIFQVSSRWSPRRPLSDGPPCDRDKALAFIRGCSDEGIRTNQQANGSVD